MNRDPLGLGVLLYGFKIAEWQAIDPGMFALVSSGTMELAHEGCAVSTFCKNPLHPGPCKGWKKKLGVEAPGALKAIQSAHAEKVAAKRVKTAEAKSAAAARAHAQGIHSPLHAKKATIKHANVLLGNDEAKAGGKADKVILNKAEIKRYSKIKAAHVNSIRAKHGLEEDPGLEDRLAEAFAADNKNGDDTNYRASIFTAGHTLGTQLAEQHCKKGDHDCDGKAFEALRDKLAEVAQNALLTGNDEPLDKALADYDAGKLDLTAPAPKPKITQAAKGQALAEANAKAEADAAAEKEAQALADAAAKAKKTAPKKPVPAKDVADMDGSEAVAAVHAMTPEQWAELTGKQKVLYTNKVNKAYGDGLPGADAAAQKVSALKKVSPVKAAPKKAPAAPGNGEAEPDFLQQLIDAVPMSTGEPPQVTSAKQALAAEGVPQWELKQAAAKLKSEDWAHFTPEEQTKLKAALASPPPKPFDPDAPPSSPSALLSPDAKKASDLAHGFVSGTAKQKLAAYEKVSKDDFDQMIPNTQKLVLADLMSIKNKFLDPKKKQQAQAVHDHLSTGTGGGAGAGGGGAAVHAAPGDADLTKAMQDLPKLASLTKGPGQKDHSDSEVKGAFQAFVDASGHEKAADALSKVWADNALASINDMHADPLGAMPYDQSVLDLAKPALAADIKKKMLGQPGHTPHLDAFETAKTFGGIDDADNFVSDAIKAGNPGLPSNADHHDKAVKLSKLWQDAAPGWSKKTTDEHEHDIMSAGGLGYDTATYKAYVQQQGDALAAGVMGGGLKALGFGTDEKVAILGNPKANDVLEAMTSEMAQAVDEGGLVPKGGYVEEFHNAVGEAKQAADTLAAKNGWATDAPVVTEYKKTILATKIDEMAAKIGGTAPASTTHPTGGAGAGGTGGSGSGKIHLGGGTDSGFTDAQNQVVTGTLKSQGINLSSSAQEVWDVAVAAAAAHQGKDGLPSSLTVLDVLNATDAGHAKNLGVTNSNLLRKKVVDWLGTPAGKKYAEDNSTPKPTLAAKLSGDLSIKLPPGQKVQILSGPGPYSAKHNGPWAEKNVTAAFADQQKLWDAQPDVPWNITGHSYLSPGYKTKWTDEQLDGLYSYTLGSGTINAYLRGETPNGTPVTTASHATKQTILNIQSAMMPLQEDHLFKRGTGWEQFPPGFRDPEAVKQLIGKNVTEKAFLSTSVPGGGSSGFGGPVRMEIEAPKGTHAAFLEGLSAFKGGVEQEMLLAAGQVMRVLSVKQDGHQTVVRVRIVTPK